jgi:hypothetical protein
MSVTSMICAYLLININYLTNCAIRDNVDTKNKKENENIVVATLLLVYYCIVLNVMS